MLPHLFSNSTSNYAKSVKEELIKRGEILSTLSQLLITVVPLAIASMVSPLSVITIMTVLGAGENRARKGILYVSTYFATFAVICLIFLAIGRVTTSGGKPSLTTMSIDIILGVLLLYSSARSFVKRKSESKTFDPSTMGTTATVTMGAFFGVGNISSSLPALAASKDIGVAAVSPIDKAIAFAITMVIAMSWSWAPLAMYVASPKNFDQYLSPFTRWLKKHGGQLIALMFLLVGLCLLIRGVSDFIAM